MSIMEDLSSSANANLLLTPVSLINGTREGFSALIASFGGLKFSTKMVLLFLLSVSVLSITLGLYSFGPPIIAVGAIGVLIPIILFILLQNDEIQRKENKEGGKEPVDSLGNVLDLISDAIKKYEVQS
jgi:hypothetical protein